MLNDVVSISVEVLDELKQEAKAAEKKRARICLHNSIEDSVQEMLIAFERGSLIAPHRHRGKTESFHIVEGRLSVLLFSESGQLEQRLRFGEAGSGLPFLYRLNADHWHSIFVESQQLIMHEIVQGPFDGQMDVAPWAPTQPNELQSFLESHCPEESHD